jgi:trypsin
MAGFRLVQALVVLIAVSSVAHAQSAKGEQVGSDSETLRRIEAATAFARQLAPEGSEAFARAFRQALQTADQLQIVIQVGRAGPERIVRGSVESDDRYRRNLASMLQNPTDRIWGGRRAPVGSFPDAVAVRGSGALCSGTLIAPNVILTAAHCHCGGVNSEAIFGETIRNSTETIPIDRSQSLIACEERLRQGDLAVMFLRRPSNAAPRRFANSDWIDGAPQIRIVGFGRTENPEGEPSGTKRIVDVPVASNSCTGAIQSGTNRIRDEVYYDCQPSKELVAGAPMLDRDSCNGDSGGGAYITGPDGELFLAAVTSRAVDRSGLRRCGDGGIYVRVDGEALRWLNSLSKGIQIGSSGH